MPDAASCARKTVTALTGSALALAGLTLLSPAAHAASTGLVISEVYGGGGNSGARWKNDFIELYNPTSSPVTVDGWSVQYRSGSGSGTGVTPLTGTVQPGAHYLVQEAAGSGGTLSLPHADASGTLAMGGGAGVAFLATTKDPVTVAAGSIPAQVVDLVGYGNATVAEGSPAPGTALTANQSVERRTAGADTDSNSADFKVTEPPTPTNAAGDTQSPDPVVTSPGNRIFLVGQPITAFTLDAAGGAGPYTWSAVGLPAGLTLDGDTISGTPTATGRSTVTLKATDSATPPATGTATITVDVADPSVTTPIAEIQGTTDTSPKANTVVTTDGVVTAIYRSGGLDGMYVQTGGTGGGTDATPDASDAVFVYGGPGAAKLPAGVEKGDSVRVTGAVTEFSGLTELNADLGTITELDSALPAVTPLATAYPTTAAGREAHEGELLAPTDRFTVTNSYNTNQYAEIGLATGTRPLVQPTEVTQATDADGIAAVKADNAARAVTLDDAATINFLGAGDSQDLPLPWLTRSSSVRVGAEATLHQPVVLDYRNGTWKFEPTHQVTDQGTDVATFEDTRPADVVPADVGGDLKLATYNVQNYFTTTGADYVTYGGTCTFYDDRDGNHIGDNTCTSPTGGSGPRGAATQASFERQRAKIVTAINALGADIVSLEEIENSMKLAIAAKAGSYPGSPSTESWRDEALADLVKALNAAAGSRTWAFVPSPTEATTTANIASQDVIRTGFIYKPAKVVPVGASDIYFGEPADTAFANAREPLAQAFKPKGHPNADAFAVVVSHFKSKGDSNPPATGDNANGEQGAFNGDRVRQATALVTFANEFAAARKTDKIFLTGDFNAYSSEDPVRYIESKGFTAVESDDAGDETYSYQGLYGSMDHVFASAAALNSVTGADVWNINAEEPIAYNYSRYNYNATDFFDPSVPFSGSDHNPEIVGIDVADDAGQRDIQILGTNDFHGRLQNNTSNTEAGAAVLAGAVKQLRAQNPDTVFAAAGDLIGASTFESFIQEDKPTIDALNEAGLEVSAVGNHEFDKGYRDLVERVMAPYDAETNPHGGAQWHYIGANVKYHATGNTVVPASWVKDMDGVQVGFIGAVTEDLPSLVSPAGLEGIDVSPIVSATNAEATVLKKAGADIIVLLVHEGASSTDCATMDDDPASAFGKIITGVDDDVDAIISGHTHLEYNCSFPVQSWIDEGRAVTERPVVSAGQYGMALDQLVYTVDADGTITGLTQNTLDLKGSSAAFNYPADAATASIVSDAVAKAATLGAKVLGKLDGGFSRAKFQSGGENRGGESTLGNLVAEVQRAQTPASLGGAQIAFMNPGGLRTDMLGTGTGAFPRDLTYAQAAGVQPFANTLVTMKLTGAQIKKVLEQQWQRTATDTVPSRAFLKLGISKGFSYTYNQTDDPAHAGQKLGHVSGMWLNGAPIDPAATYSVTVNSFLAAGGDNFWELGKGTQKKDTGITDLQAMVDYMAKFGTDALPVDFSQRGVGITFPDGAPTAYGAGDHVTFDVSSLSMTGIASGIAADKTDSQVVAELGGTELGTFPVTTTVSSSTDNSANSNDEAGTAHVDVVLPATIPAGAVLTLRGATTGTVVRVPVTLTGTALPTPTISSRPVAVVYGRAATVPVTVTAPGVTPTGTVTVSYGSTVLGVGTLAAGRTAVTVPARTLAPGGYTLTLAYSGDGDVAAQSGTTRLTVAKGSSTITDVKVTPKKVRAKKTRATLSLSVVGSNGVAPSGTVTVSGKGIRTVTGTIRNGKVSVRLSKFGSKGKKVLTVRYTGDRYLSGSTRTVRITVVK